MSEATFMILPLDEDQKKVEERTFDLLMENYEAVREMVDQRVSGFWAGGDGGWKPADRMALYERAGPVFVTEEYLLEVVLTSFDTFGPAELAPLLMPGSMWEQMLQFEPLELVKMLRDLANLLKQRAAPEEPELELPAPVEGQVAANGGYS